MLLHQVMSQIINSPYIKFLSLPTISRWQDKTIVIDWQASTESRQGSGMEKESCQSYHVRFTIHLCMPDEKIEALIAPFTSALKSIAATSLPDLEETSSIPGITGLLNAHYKPVCLNSENDKIHVQA